MFPKIFRPWEIHKFTQSKGRYFRHREIGEHESSHALNLKTSPRFSPFYTLRSWSKAHFPSSSSQPSLLQSGWWTGVKLISFLIQVILQTSPGQNRIWWDLGVIIPPEILTPKIWWKISYSVKESERIIKSNPAKHVLILTLKTSIKKNWYTGIGISKCWDSH